MEIKIWEEDKEKIEREENFILKLFEAADKTVTKAFLTSTVYWRNKRNR